MWVETREQLQAMFEKLLAVSEFAVDLEVKVTVVLVRMYHEVTIRCILIVLLNPCISRWLIIVFYINFCIHCTHQKHTSEMFTACLKIIVFR